MARALLRDELLSRGYTFDTLNLEVPYKQYFYPSGQLAITKAGYYDYPFVSRFAKTVSKSKELSYQFVQNKGLSIPETLRTASLEEAIEFLNQHKKVVVKPENMGGGKGLTVDITTPQELEDALKRATFNNEPPLIQRQFSGEEIRFTVIAGKVRSAILRQTPRVVGDGASTVRQLIDKENEARRALVFPTLSYPQLTADVIPGHFFNDNSVLEADQVVEFSRATMIRRGASFYGVLESIHPSYLKLVEECAAQLNGPFLVIDLMIDGWQKPVHNSSYIFLEFNTSPGLEVYTSLRGGDTPDIVGLIADQLDTYSHLYS